MCSDYLSPSFGWPLRVLAPGVSLGFLASVVWNRIRGFRDFDSENLHQQELVFLSSYVFLHVRCTAHCHQLCVRAKFANRASHLSCNRFFSWGYDPSTHACEARPLTTVGRTSLSVIIIITLLRNAFDCGSTSSSSASPSSSITCVAAGPRPSGGRCLMRPQSPIVADPFRVRLERRVMKPADELHHERHTFLVEIWSKKLRRSKLHRLENQCKSEKEQPIKLLLGRPKM